MSEITDLTYHQRNRDLILNKAKDYYRNNKERLKEQARDKYKNLSEEEKNKKREYGKNRYHNMSEEKKQRLKEYQKEYQKKYHNCAQESTIKTYHKKKKTRLKSTKEKGIKNWFNIKKKH